METSPLIASKSMDRFLYDIGLRHERVNDKLINSGHGGGGNEKEKQLWKIAVELVFSTRES